MPMLIVSASSVNDSVMMMIIVTFSEGFCPDLDSLLCMIYRDVQFSTNNTNASYQSLFPVITIDQVSKKRRFVNLGKQIFKFFQSKP